ncbi:hypothetical protein Ae201684P_008654 [Aphanomyces euteiches]|nr:hypothetical protein Ae201684P_008654 [Aphanomyces euteiches]
MTQRCYCSDLISHNYARWLFVVEKMKGSEFHFVALLRCISRQHFIVSARDLSDALTSKEMVHEDFAMTHPLNSPGLLLGNAQGVFPGENPRLSIHAVDYVVA